MKPTFYLMIMVVSLAGCATEPRDSSISSAHLADVREIARHAIEEEGIVGLSVAVAVDGEIVLAEGYGHADLERVHPATADTIYDIASTGKQFTAAAIMQLVDDGALDLDDRIFDVVAETPANFPNATIYELLHHTSGFVSGTLDELNPPAGLDQPRSGLEVLDDVELQEGFIEFEPSETFQYSNSGYLLLGAAVEAVSGRTYPEFVRDRLFAPAGMRSATVFERAEGAGMADSLHRDDEGVRRVPLIHMSVYAGQGSICASVVELVHWNNALEHGEIVSEASLRAFRTPGRVNGCVEGVEMPYGMAQRLGSLHGHDNVGHTGTYEGGSAVLATYPASGLTIAVLSNTYGGGVPHARAIESRIAARMLGVAVPTEAPTARPIPAHVRRRIDGVYVDGTNHFEARVVDDTLHVLLDDEVVAELVWAGGLEFRDPEKPAVRELFIMDGEVAGWWVYEVDGMCMDVGRRKCVASPSTGP